MATHPPVEWYFLENTESHLVGFGGENERFLSEDLLAGQYQHLNVSLVDQFPQFIDRTDDLIEGDRHRGVVFTGGRDETHL